jgi:hypothetical protein
MDDLDWDMIDTGPRPPEPGHRPPTPPSPLHDAAPHARAPETGLHGSIREIQRQREAKLVARIGSADTRRDFNRSAFLPTTCFSSEVVRVLALPHAARSRADRAFLLTFAERCPLFEHLNASERKKLLHFCDVQFPEFGARLFTAGDDCSCVEEASTWVVLAGSVSIIADNGQPVSTNGVMSEHLERVLEYLPLAPARFLKPPGEYYLGSVGICSSVGRRVDVGYRSVSAVVAEASTVLMRVPAIAFAHAQEHHRKLIQANVRECMRSVGAFGSLKNDQINRLARHAKVLTFNKPNTLVFRQGAPVVGVYVVMAGSFRIIQRRRKDNKLLELQRLGAGECWGHHGLLRSSRRKKKKKKEKRKSLAAWKLLSSAVECTYSTTLMTDERESKSVAVFLSASELTHVVLACDEAKAVLQLQVMMDKKNALASEHDIQCDLDVFAARARVEAAHINAIETYQEKQVLAAKQEGMWWQDQEAAHDKMAKHVVQLAEAGRQKVGLPAMPSWLARKMEHEAELNAHLEKDRAKRADEMAKTKKNHLSRGRGPVRPAPPAARQHGTSPRNARVSVSRH